MLQRGCFACYMISSHAVDTCIDHGVSHALQRKDCRTLNELEDCRGNDKSFCDCCTRATTVRDSVFIKRDPDACSNVGETLFSGGLTFVMTVINCRGLV